MRICSYAVDTLDLKNVLNSVSLAAIERAIHHLGVLESLCRILESYVQNRVILYHTEKGERIYNTSVGIPPGSILGPVLTMTAY